MSNYVIFAYAFVWLLFTGYLGKLFCKLAKLEKALQQKDGQSGS
jgi:CcmD family protein